MDIDLTPVQRSLLGLILLPLCLFIIYRLGRLEHKADKTNQKKVQQIFILMVGFFAGDLVLLVLLRELNLLYANIQLH